MICGTFHPRSYFLLMQHMHSCACTHTYTRTMRARQRQRHKSRLLSLWLFPDIDLCRLPFFCLLWSLEYNIKYFKKPHRLRVRWTCLCEYERGSDGQRDSTQTRTSYFSFYCKMSKSEAVSGDAWEIQLWKDCSPDHLQVCVAKAQPSWPAKCWTQSDLLCPQHPPTPTHLYPTPPLILGFPSPLPLGTQNPRTFFLVWGECYQTLKKFQHIILFRGKQSLDEALESDKQED